MAGVDTGASGADPGGSADGIGGADIGADIGGGGTAGDEGCSCSTGEGNFRFDPVLFGLLLLWGLGLVWRRARG